MVPNYLDFQIIPLILSDFYCNEPMFVLLTSEVLKNLIGLGSKYRIQPKPGFSIGFQKFLIIFSSVWQNSKKLHFWTSALDTLFGFLLMQNHLAFGQTLDLKLFLCLPTTCTDTIILMIIKFSQN